MRKNKNVDHHYEKVAINENEKVHGNDHTEDTHGYGVRHVQMLIVFSSLCISFIARGHLGVTIVAMIDAPHRANDTNVNNSSTVTSTGVNNTTIPSEVTDLFLNRYTQFNGSTESTPFVEQQSQISIANESITNRTESTWNVYRTYKWSTSVQEMLLGSFFVGYMIMMFPMGLVCQRWGGKLPLQIGLMMTGIVSILTPWLAAWGGWKAICASRIATGLVQAGTYPGIQTLVAKWAPASERGRLTSYVYTGSMIGNIIAFQAGGLLATSPWGWPSNFWVVGAVCILAFVLLTAFGAATPHQHKYISDEERNFIVGSGHDSAEKRHRTPWKSILSSKHVWAIFASHVGSSTSFLFLFTQVPSYLHFVLNINVKNSGLLSSLPYLGNFIMSIALGYLCDFSINRNILTVKQTRIISTMIANIGPAVCLAAVSFTSSPSLAVACLVTAMTCLAGSHTGWMINYIDLAPNFSGALMATGNTMMNIMAIATPMVISYIVTDATNPRQWRIVLLLVGGVALLLNCVFVAFMSAEEQPWNSAPCRPTVTQEARENKEKAVKKQTEDIK